ncbi:MAG: hypothetical protein AAF371_11915 [Pseudomonadota bacterium]
MLGDTETEGTLSPQGSLVQQRLEEALAALHALPKEDRLALTGLLARRACVDLADGGFDPVAARARLTEIATLCQITAISLDAARPPRRDGEG